MDSCIDYPGRSSITHDCIRSQHGKVHGFFAVPLESGERLHVRLCEIRDDHHQRRGRRVRPYVSDLAEDHWSGRAYVSYGHFLDDADVRKLERSLS